MSQNQIHAKCPLTISGGSSKKQGGVSAAASVLYTDGKFVRLSECHTLHPPANASMCRAHFILFTPSSAHAA